MPSAVKWEAGLVDEGTVIDTGATLASDTFSALGSEFDNATDLETLGWFVLETSTGNLFSSAVTRVGASIDIYVVREFDGTNYELTPDDPDEFPAQLIARIPISLDADIVPVGVGPVTLPPCAMKFLVFNNTDQTMQNTWQLSLHTSNLEGQ